MQIGVAYGDGRSQVWLAAEVPDACSVREAIQISGLLARFPDLDIDNHPVGIFGRLSKLEAEVSAGDRIEIYRPIVADPETAERRDT